jgi:transcriptional regulator with XRE-family HTH domain
VRNTRVSAASSSRARTFGQTLRDTRRQARVSQDDLAQRSGVDRSAISNYERGRREPNLRTIVKLARALDVEPASLLRDL